MSTRALTCAAGLLALLAGCAAPPAVPLDTLGIATPPPPGWRSPTDWRPAAPSDDADKGAWWRPFGDAELSALIDGAQREHPVVAVALARLRQAEAGRSFARANTLPRLDASLRLQRQRTSANRPATGTASVLSTVQNDTIASVGAAYEVDLFDRLASELEVSAASERQARSDLANVRLVLAADLAAAYFALRQTDAEIAVLEQSIAVQRRAGDLLQARHAGGASSRLELAQQQALLDTTLTQLALLRRQRPLIEHQLATLSGRPAPAFVLASQAAWQAEVPRLPAALPAEVLQRRPDVASAQHAVGAAAAQVGVARAAFFPALTLGVSAGVESRSWRWLFDAPSALWTVGAGLTQPLWDAGRNQARHAGALAGLDAANGLYRRTVLQALQEVEDGLSNLDTLAAAAASAQQAIDSAALALDIAQARYDGGLVTYLEVVAARQTLLTARRQAVQIQGSRLVAAAQLAKAIGGGWSG